MISFFLMANMFNFPGSQATDQFCKNKSEQEDQNAIDGDPIFKILHSRVKDFLFVELALVFKVGRSRSVEVDFL